VSDVSNHKNLGEIYFELFLFYFPSHSFFLDFTKLQISKRLKIKNKANKNETKEISSTKTE
jgi:hypothetical protein